VPISPIVPLAPVIPTAGATLVGRDEVAALALARAALNRSPDVLGLLGAQTTPSDDEPSVVAPGNLGGEPQDVDAQAAELRSPTVSSRSTLQEPLERAVALAADRAVQRQGGLAPLMADMAQAALEPTTPPRVKQAIDQVLALARPLDPNVTASHVRQALDQSGLFLEARLAAGQSHAGPVPEPRRALPDPSNDLKAALLVFRQVVRAWTEVVAPPAKPTTATPPQQAPLPATLTSSVPALPSMQPRDAADPGAQLDAPDGLTPHPGAAARPTPAPALAGGGVSATLRASAETRLGGADDVGPGVLETPDGVASGKAPEPGPARPLPVVTRSEVPGLVAKTFERAVAEALSADPALSAAETPSGPPVAKLAPDESGTGHRSRPAPPPYAGAPTHAQPAAQPGLPPGSHPGDVAHRLLQGAGAALARTELLQLASRPEAAVVGTKAEEPGARWVFDMPFPTPQGPAVAQFEISRDGGGGEAGVREMGRTWRARFSLDVEPMGPIHAQIALTGDRARVSLWAERPDGMARLRGEQSSLQAALREAALEPELVFHPGSPQGPVVEPGRFVDRAT